MPVQIGQKRESDFSDPLGLLSDCHRRIERFLAVLNRVASECAGGGLSPEEQAAFENALRYFQEAAPRHTADEEESLFPRLRSSRDPAARTALASLAALEADHTVAAQDHAVVDRLGHNWIDNGPLSEQEHSTVSAALSRLSNLYARHIVVEDADLFPLAARVLQPDELASIGEEMAARRGLPSL